MSYWKRNSKVHMRCTIFLGFVFVVVQVLLLLNTWIGKITQPFPNHELRVKEQSTNVHLCPLEVGGGQNWENFLFT